MPDLRLCVAPMMARSDRHDGYFLRRLSRHGLLHGVIGACLMAEPGMVRAAVARVA